MLALVAAAASHDVLWIPPQQEIAFRCDAASDYFRHIKVDAIIQRDKVEFSSAVQRNITNNNPVQQTAAARSFASRACLSITDYSCDSVFLNYSNKQWKFPSPGSFAVVTDATEPVTTCGGEYVPPGGMLGDLSPELYVPFARNVSSLVFRLPAAAARRISTFSHPKLCVFTRTMDFSQEVGTLNLIGESEDEELKLPSSEGREMFVSVRSFLQPGWSFDYQVVGGSESGILALKAHTCNDFADSNAYRLATASSSEAIASSSDGISVRNFAFRANFKEEVSNLGQWRVFSFSRKRLIPKAAAPPFSLAGTSGVAAPSNVVKAGAADWGTQQDSRNLRIKEATEYIVRLYLCYYPTSSDLGGIPLGDVIFQSDKADSIELVALVVFAVVGVPFLLGLTVSCYGYKHRKLRRTVRRHRLMLRREEIEERLVNQLEMPMVESDDDDDDE